jgi:CIC family chloride channel protein
MIVLELTGSYSLALASTIGIVTATMISGQLFEHSIFDKQLLSRGIDLSQGRMGIRLMEENITKITSSNVLKFKPEVIVDVAKAEMVKMQVNEAYVNTHEGKYIGKLHLKALIFAKPSDAIIKYTDTEALNIKSDASLQQAIETAANFIGETIPIVDRSTGTLIGTINEGDLLKMYLDLQGQTIDLEKR